MNLKQKILLKIKKEKKKNYVKGMSSDFAVSDPDDPTTKKIKKYYVKNIQDMKKIVLMEKRLIPHVRQFPFI